MVRKHIRDMVAGLNDKELGELCEELIEQHVRVVFGELRRKYIVPPITDARDCGLSKKAFDQLQRCKEGHWLLNVSADTLNMDSVSMLRLTGRINYADLVRASLEEFKREKNHANSCKKGEGIWSAPSGQPEGISRFAGHCSRSD